MASLIRAGARSVPEKLTFKLCEQPCEQWHKRFVSQHSEVFQALA